MALAIAALISVIIFLLLYVFILTGGERLRLEQRLREAGDAMSRRVYVDEELARPLYYRLFFPLFRALGSVFGRITPQGTRQMFAGKIADAGGFDGIGLNDFLMLWGGLAVLLAGSAAAIAGFVFHAAANKVISIGLLGFAVGMLLPMLALNRRIVSRRTAINKSLPEVLDLVCVSIRAGMAFDGAVAKVAEKMKGPLVDECTKMLQETRMGVPRREALKAMADRCKVADVSMLTVALIQADQLGVSISQVLDAQADSLRKRRLLLAREVAMKTPVKLLFPLVFCIFPTMYVVLLGPAMITILRNFLQR